MSIVYGKNTMGTVPYGTRIVEPTPYEPPSGLKCDFTEIQKAWNGTPSKPEYRDVWAVEVITTFRKIVFVKANSAEEAKQMQNTKMSFLQKHLGDVPISATKVLSDKDMVHHLVEMEHPNLTTEEFLARKEKWMKHLVYGV